MLVVRAADVSLFRRLQTPVCTRLVTHIATAATCSGNDKRLHPPHNYHHSKDHICITLYDKVMQMLLYCTLDYFIIMIDGSHEIDWDTVKPRLLHMWYTLHKINWNFLLLFVIGEKRTGNISFLGRLFCGSSINSGSDQSRGVPDWKAVK